jgi:RHH-type transcriptional regulator, proline utilization regulon repressor / proline dehydrogenase / delta 1-pyrroline-5-carboxylate dehydrogenase
MSSGPSLSVQQLEEGWTLYTPHEFAALCLELGDFTLSFREIFERFKKTPLSWGSFRLQIRLDGVPLMLGVFPEQKELRLASARLNNELFAIHVQDFAGAEQFILDEDYKAHIEKIACLDPREFPSQYQRTTFEHQLPDILANPYPEHKKAVEGHYQELVDRLLGHLHQYRPVFFERLSDVGLSLVAQYALLRIHLLKFLAILPSLDHDRAGAEVKKMLIESLRRLLEDSRLAKRLNKKRQERALSKRLRLSFAMAFTVSRLMPAKLLAQIIRASVRFMARRFIAGESIEETERSFQGLFSTGRDVTLDQLGELVVSEKEADHYRDEVLKLIRGLGAHIPRGERNNVGIHRAHVSIKVSALCSHFIPEDLDVTYHAVAPRLKEILLTAREHDVFLNIDAEHYHYRDIVLMIYRRVLLETPELKDFSATGIVLQAYLRDSATHLNDILALAQERKLLMPIRLVKGAYWDAETVEADAHSFNAPQYLNKEETDLMFRQMVLEILKHGQDLQLCLASHNFADHCFAETYREVVYPKAPGIEHQCLHMTYEALSTSLAKMGWATRNYVPIGSLLVGMAYLVRRIMENSSQVGVLTIMRSHKKAASLMGPEAVHREKLERKALARDLTLEQLTEKFFNCAPLRTYLADELGHARAAIAKFKELKLAHRYENPFKVSGEQKTIVSSSDPSIQVGLIQFSTVDDATRALAQAEEAFCRDPWCDTTERGIASRAWVLTRAANLMLARRNELSALIMYEAGKALKEALADVDEAVDFLNFYAREELRLAHSDRIESLMGRGPTVVISPWNFPLAIPCGMAAASLVAGNPVILKSAEQTPLIAQVLVDLLHEAGVPKNILIHLPGEGETVGAALVSSPKTAAIVFTGSKAVGLLIAKSAGPRLYTNPKTKATYPVRVITEMGGKNAIIVTANAELDETVAGILYSAYGHAGQKCSAASRVIVHRSVSDRLKERLKAAIADLHVGSALNFSTDVNPLITQEDQARVRECAKEATLECEKYGGEVVIDRTHEQLPGYCVGPALFELPYERGLVSESWSQREVFGPIVHMIAFDGLEAAIDLFNGTEYALTGGVFSQSQDEIDWLTERMECGNIYVNRTITGARVAVEPFGGFKLSGTGPKAGGRSYLRSLHLLHHSMPDSPAHPAVQRDEGSEYQFDLARPSGLLPQARCERLSVLIKELHQKYEVYFHRLEGANKETLERFQKWIDGNLVSFITKQHTNRKIPGQISYNDFQRFQEHALLIGTRPVPELLTVMQVLACLGVGTGLTVVARERATYLWWMTFRDLAHSSGFSRENFEVYYPSQEGLKKALELDVISTIILDGGPECFEYLAHSSSAPLRMRSVLSLLDAVDPQNFKALCEHYIWVRSFAINTMRHGAPLELEL